MMKISLFNSQSWKHKLLEAKKLHNCRYSRKEFKSVETTKRKISSALKHIQRIPKKNRLKTYSRNVADILRMIDTRLQYIPNNSLGAAVIVCLEEYNIENPDLDRLICSIYLSQMLYAKHFKLSAAIEETDERINLIASDFPKAKEIGETYGNFINALKLKFKLINHREDVLILITNVHNGTLNPSIKMIQGVLARFQNYTKPYNQNNTDLDVRILQHQILELPDYRFGATETAADLTEPDTS